MAKKLADRALELFTTRDEPALSDLFDDRMRASVPPEKLKSVWRRTDLSGRLVATGDPLARERRDGGELFDYPLKYERRLHHLQVVIRNGRVSGLLVRPGEPTGRWRRSRGAWRQFLRPTAAH